MREYEAMLIIKPELQEEQFKKATNDLVEMIKKNKGEIISADKWADRKDLAYEIRVPATGGYAKHKQGYYYLINFKIETAAIEKLKHSFKLDDNVLRVLITVKK